MKRRLTNLVQYIKVNPMTTLAVLSSLLAGLLSIWTLYRVMTYPAEIRVEIKYEQREKR